MRPKDFQLAKPFCRNPAIVRSVIDVRKVIDWLPEAIKQNRVQLGTPVVLWGRVSSPGQNRNGNLKDQLAMLKKEVEMLGLRVVGQRGTTRSGAKSVKVNLDDIVKYEHQAASLASVARLARKANAILVAESTDRFIRPTFYHYRTNPNAKYTAYDMEQLAEWTEGVRLFTLIKPEASLMEIRSEQTKRGMKSKDGTLDTERELRKAIWKVYHKLPPKN